MKTVTSFRMTTGFFWPSSGPHEITFDNRCYREELPDFMEQSKPLDIDRLYTVMNRFVDYQEQTKSLDTPFLRELVHEMGEAGWCPDRYFLLAGWGIDNVYLIERLE